MHETPFYSAVIKVYTFLTQQVNYSLIRTESYAAEDTPFFFNYPLLHLRFLSFRLPGQMENRVELSLGRKGEKTKQRNMFDWFGVVSPRIVPVTLNFPTRHQTNSLNSPQPSAQHDSNASFLYLMSTLRANVGFSLLQRRRTQKNNFKVSFVTASTCKTQRFTPAN